MFPKELPHLYDKDVAKKKAEKTLLQQVTELESAIVDEYSKRAKDEIPDPRLIDNMERRKQVLQRLMDEERAANELQTLLS